MRLPIRATAFPLALISLPLALGATTLYWGGGSSNIADGTDAPHTAAGLAGTWNSTLENWGSAIGSPNTYNIWADGAYAFLGRRSDTGNVAYALETGIAPTASCS